MNALSWTAIAEQLRAVGVDVPVTAIQGNGDLVHAPSRPSTLMCRTGAGPADLQAQRRRSSRPPKTRM